MRFKKAFMTSRISRKFDIYCVGSKNKYLARDQGKVTQITYFKKIQYTTTAILITCISSIFSCVHEQSTKAKPIVNETPNWVGRDCIKEDSYYYFVGYGEGENLAEAISNALIYSRKNALTCVLGGTITSKIELSQSETTSSYLESTKIDINYSHVNWAGYEAMQGRLFIEKQRPYAVYGHYRWSIKQIEDEQKRLKSLAKKIEENKALEAEISLAKKIDEERKKLIKEQKKELEKLKAHENEIKNLKSESDKVIAKLSNMKKERDDIGKEFVNMVTRMGCDVTYDDLVELLGEPDSIEVLGICYKRCDYNLISEWVPVLSYIYDRYKINAYVNGAIMVGESNWSRYKKYKHRAQIVDIDKIVGSKASWWICKKGYDFVKRRLKKR